MYQGKSIVIYLNGETQYEAGNLFMIMLSQEFKRLGFDVIEIDLTQEQNTVITGITQSVEKNPVCFLSYNGILANLNSNGKSLYDIFDIPMLAWLVDHPALHYSRLETGGKRILAGCIDKTHAQMIPQTTSMSISGFFCPHFACCDVNQTINKNNSTFDIIMPATFGEPAVLQAEKIKSGNNKMSDLFHFLTEHTDIDATSDINLLAMQWLKDQHIFLSRHDLAAFFSTAITPIDTYIRARRREDLLHSFKEVGITVDIYGNAPQGHPAFDGHHYHGPINFNKLQQIMTQSTVVLDGGANYSNGTHERVLTAAALGNIVVTPKNIVWSRVFDKADDIHLYSPEASIESAEKILKIKQYNNFETTGDARKIISEQFTVTQTVEKMLTLNSLGLLH